MAKRFTDTNKYKKPFYRALPGAYKLLWDFLYHDCDNAGIWIADSEAAQMFVGKDSPIDLNMAIDFFNKNEERIIVLQGDKWFIPSFIEFQYGHLSEKNRAHISAINILNKYDLLNTDYSIKKNLKEPTSPLQGAKDKVKERDTDKDMDKEQDKDFGKSENLSSEYKPGSLVAEMKNVFKKSVTNYPEDISRDAKALFSIAKFFCATAKINAPPESEKDRILEAWEPVSIWISKDNFYGQKSLSTISNHIQEIVQKALHGDKAKNRQPAGASRDEIQAIVNERANSRR